MNRDRSVRVLIVDDHALVRHGLHHYLSVYDWIDPIGQAENGSKAVEFCSNHEVDIILMDLVMPVMDGTEATRQIKARAQSPEIIVLTSFHEQTMVEDALEAGAIGYLLKNVSAEELAGAIRSAADGHSTLSPEATDALIAATRQHNGVGFNLTDRELETLALVAKGMSNQEIADQLIISNRTVTFHLTNIFTKLGARNRVEATAIALEHDLVNHTSDRFSPQ